MKPLDLTFSCGSICRTYFVYVGRRRRPGPTFSVANDVAKYFAIIPAMFAGAFPVLNVLNVMHLRTPQSAILSAVIFNALIIIALIPLALRGVRYRPLGAAALLQRNLLIYGVGGIVAPFIGIKFIDVLLTYLRVV